MSKINYKVLSFLALFFLLINFFSYKVIKNEEKQKIDLILAGHINTLATYYEMVLFDQKRRSLSLSKSTFMDKRVLEIFTQANNTQDSKILDSLRKELQTILTKKYDILKTEGILQYHFIFPNNVTFLRMHKPSKFGDDLSSVRLDFVEANKDREEVHGFHRGRTSHAFRNIYPIYADSGQYLGILDVAFSSQVLQDYMNGVGKIHTHFLVKKDIFDTKAWQRDDMKAKYIQSHEHKDYVIGISKYFNENSYNKNKKKFIDIKETINSKIKKEKKFAIYVNDNAKITVISFYPVKSSVTGKLSAWVVSYEENKSIEIIQKDSKYYFAVLFVTLSVVFIFLAIFINLHKISFIQIDDKYQRRLFLSFFIIFIIIFAIIYAGLAFIKNESIYSYMKKIEKENIREFSLLKEQNRVFSQHIFSKHIDTTEIKLLIKGQKREELYQLLKDDYKNWKKEFHIGEVHFHTPDVHSFLRMHKPEKYGDSLVGFRKGVVFVSKNRTVFEGFEEGKVDSGFRYIYPLFLGKEYLGSVEVSFTSLGFIKNLSSSFGKRINILFNAKIVDKDMFKENKKDYIKSPVKGFYFNKEILHYLSKKSENITSHNKSLVDLDDTSKKILKGDVFSKYYKEAKDFVVIIPIKNKITKEVIVSFHTINESKYIENQSNIFRFNLLLAIFILILIMLIAYKSFTEKQKNMIKQLEQNELLKEEVQKALAENTRQLQVLQQQTKMAAMGEMIGAIAHQWRQPLNAVGLSIQNLEYDYKMGLVDEKFVQEYIEENTKIIEFMSKTIDDFRNFFRVDKEKREFSFKNAIEETVRMQSAQLNTHNIKLNISGEDSEFLGLKSEFQQVILNIINNAKDALLEKEIETPEINIVIAKKLITIKDNAGGIPSDIIERIFEPYFTTKEQGKGTGMGLYMSKMIIEENMDGILSVKTAENSTIFSIKFI